MSTSVLPGSAVPASRARDRSRSRLAITVLSALVGVLGLVYALDVLLTRGSVPRGVEVRGIAIGGKSVDEAERLLTAGLRTLGSAPIFATAGEQSLQVEPARAGLRIDVAGTVSRARTQALAPWSRVAALFTTRSVEPFVDVDADVLRAEVARLAKSIDRPAREGSVVFDGITPKAVLPQDGRKVDVNGAAVALAEAYLDPNNASDAARLPMAVDEVKSSAAAVQSAFTDVAQPAVSGPVLVRAAGKSVSVPPAVIADALVITADASGTITPRVDAKALDKALLDLLAPLETEPRDAEILVTPTGITFGPSANGRMVDVDALAQGLLPVVSRRDDRVVDARLVMAEPKLTTERAKALGIKEVIGTFTTAHPCCRPRVQNIHRMADLIDGHVVLPGEKFSINGFIGERTRRNGFTEAPMILDGKFVDAVGGGVSQFATTMYNAVFFSGLKDITHKAHSIYISRYPAGREATVSFPAPDLAWQNDSPHGVLIKTEYTDKTITVTFYGTKVWDSVESISGPRTRQRSSRTRYESGPGCESHRGGPGFDIVVFRVFKKAGVEVKRERIFTRYLPDDTIVCRR